MTGFAERVAELRAEAEQGEAHECAFCLADVPAGKRWCNAACKASWSLLFEDPEQAEPEPGIEDSDTLPLDY